MSPAPEIRAILGLTEVRIGLRTLWYSLYAALLAVVSIFTGEIVTFVLLGLILIALNHILDVLKEIARKLDKSRMPIEDHRGGDYGPPSAGKKHL